MKIKERILIGNDGYDYAEKFDIKGRVIYEKYPTTYGVYEKSYEYDENGKCIYTIGWYNRKKLAEAEEEFFKYDDRGNEIWYRFQVGAVVTQECWSEYDENNRCIYHKWIDDEGEEEEWNKYDENGNVIYSKSSKTGEQFYEYDDNNNCITGYACTYYDEDYEEINNE